jgi:hypothetical protein
VPTTVTPEITRGILAKNDSPDVPFDRSINPYKGCEHGCVYCFARPTHSYLGLSPGLDFETKIVSSPRRRLEETLRKPSYSARSSRSARTPILPADRAGLRITRSLLEVFERSAIRSASSRSRTWSCATSTLQRGSRRGARRALDLDHDARSRLARRMGRARPARRGSKRSRR